MTLRSRHDPLPKRKQIWVPQQYGRVGRAQNTRIYERNHVNYTQGNREAEDWIKIVSLNRPKNEQNKRQWYNYSQASPVQSQTAHT